MATRLSRIAGVKEVNPMLSVPGTVRARGRVVSLYVAATSRARPSIPTD